MKANLDVYVRSLLDELDHLGLKVEKVILDAPERAAAWKQKQHGGYYSCDLCLANPENIQIPGKRGSKLVSTTGTFCIFICLSGVGIWVT